jgi:predicted nucleotidyltransferase
VISAYERGRRQPSLPTLERIVAATGQHLAFQILAGPYQPASGLQQLVTDRRDAILESANRHGVADVRLFAGTPDGDADRPEVNFLVRQLQGTGLSALLSFCDDVQDLLGIHVNVTPEDPLRPPLPSETIPL